MPRPKDNARLLDLAKRGAQAQLNDLVHEMKILLELFPRLRDSLDADELPLSFLLKKGSDKARRRGAEPAKDPEIKKRKLSAARKKATQKEPLALEAVKKV